MISRCSKNRRVPDGHFRVLQTILNMSRRLHWPKLTLGSTSLALQYFSDFFEIFFKNGHFGPPGPESGLGSGWAEHGLRRAGSGLNLHLDEAALPRVTIAPP